MATTLLENRNFSLLSSLGLHLLLFAALAGFPFLSAPLSPLGVESPSITMVNLEQAPALSPLSTHSTKSSPNAVKAAANASKSENASTPFSKPAPAAPAGAAEGRELSARERYLFELRSLIEQKKVYPPLARRLGESGVVSLEFSVLKDGKIVDPRIKAASAHDRLNKAAMELLEQVRNARPLPDEIRGEKLTVVLPIDYQLN